ncbi:MAG: hypothetical protein EXS31_18245 [Pedosphaera sp.]|nr:hypothetical protein [Pedosphaera sp.]
MLLGLYHLALLNSQRRLKSETARQIDGYVQARLEDILRLQAEAMSLRQRSSSSPPFVNGSNGCQADDSSLVARDLVGAATGELRDRVAKASEAEPGTLLLHFDERPKMA